MAQYPYLMNTGSLRRFLEHIQGAGIPQKVTIAYLVASGFQSSNDRPIVKVLKSLGFVDSAGTPTSVWQEYRNQQVAPTVLASAIRKTYAELFTMYPDAHRKDDEALLNFFRAQTSLGKTALGAVLGTFKALSGMADFGAVPGEVVQAQAKPSVATEHKVTVGQALMEGLTLNINIQLQLPATEDATVYEKLFEALKRHLFTKEV